MWITTPDMIERILLESQLEPVSDEVLNQSARDWQSRGVKLTSHDALRILPVVSIGQPETWPLKDLYAPKTLPRLIQTKLKQADFYLVRFSCSFRPLHEESRVEWARFCVNLLPHPTTGKHPMGFDFYPQQVMQEEAKRQIKVTLSPLLKFQELEASLGSAEFGFENPAHVPIISAALGTSFDPSWDYRSDSTSGVLGTRWMYLLVKAPKGLASGQARLELEADVLVRGTRIAAKVRRQPDQAGAQLIVSLWG
jgi:hypothetical protein